MQSKQQLRRFFVWDLIQLRWEFIKENNKIRKQELDQERKKERKQDLDQKATKRKRKNPLVEFLFSFFFSCFLVYKFSPLSMAFFQLYACGFLISKHPYKLSLIPSDGNYPKLCRRLFR